MSLLLLLRQHTSLPITPVDPPEGDGAFARRALAQSRLWFRPVLPVPDGTLDAGDRLLLARRGYGRKT